MRRVVLVALALVVAIIFLPPRLAPLLGWGPDGSHLPPRGKSVPIDGGLALNVVDIGQGSPIVLVHGLPSCASDWKDVPQKLAALGHRVIVYDRVGYGFSSRSDATPDRYTYESNAADLKHLFDHLGIESAAVVGWSYGGAVVQTLAEHAAQRVTHVVLVAAVGPAQPRDRSEPIDYVLASPIAAGILHWVGSLPPISHVMTEQSLVQAFARAEDIPPGWTEYTQDMLALPGTLDAFVWEAQRGRESGLRPEILKMPVLVIQGTDDNLVPPAVGEDLHRRIPQSKLLMVPHGSHMLPVTHADLLAHEIHEFVSG